MNTINKILAQFFDRLKVSQPVIYFAVVSVLVAVQYILTEGSEVLSFIPDNVIDIATTIIAAILGTRTFNYLKDAE